MNSEIKVGKSVRLKKEPLHPWLIIEEVSSHVLPSLRRFWIRNPHSHERIVLEDEIELLPTLEG